MGLISSLWNSSLHISISPASLKCVLTSLYIDFVSVLPLEESSCSSRWILKSPPHISRPSVSVIIRSIIFWENPYHFLEVHRY